MTTTTTTTTTAVEGRPGNEGPPAGSGDEA